MSGYWDSHLQTWFCIVAQPQCCSEDTDFRGNTMDDIQRRREQTLWAKRVRDGKRNGSFWGLHVTCLTTISTGRGFRVSWGWAGGMDAQALIGSSLLPIFRLVSCPSLVCVQLCFGMKDKTSLSPHHIMETHWELLHWLRNTPCSVIY